MVDYQSVIRPLYDMPYGKTTMGLAIDSALGANSSGSDKCGPLRWSNKETEDALEAAQIGGKPEQIAMLIKANRKQGFYDTLIHCNP